MLGLFRRKKFANNADRIIVIHNHLFKNAGSTIDWALKKNFGKYFVDHRDDKDMQSGPDYMRDFICENPKLCALSTHHLLLPLPLLDKTKFMTIMMFRHPIERVTSVYNFERKQKHATTLGAKFARSHNLRQYVEWRMRNDIPPTIRNFHTTRCLNGKVNWRKKLNEDDLRAAKEYIESIEMLGLVDRFNESIILFENTLAEQFSEIDLSFKVQNVSQKINEPSKNRIDKLCNEIGGSVFEKLIECNSADLALYEYAQKLVDRRLSNIKNLTNKLEEFKMRCQQHTGNF